MTNISQLLQNNRIENENIRIVSLDKKAKSSPIENKYITAEQHMIEENNQETYLLRIAKRT